MVNRFQKFFSYDENDQPRQWPNMTAEKLSQIFLKAKDEAIILLDALTSIKIDIGKLIKKNEKEEDNSLEEKEEDEINDEIIDFVGQYSQKENNNNNSNLILLSDALKQTELQKAIYKMQSICKDAQYIQATGGVASWKSIPLLFWVVLLIFSYNEISATISLLFSSWLFFPFIFAPSLTVGVAYYTGNFFNLVKLCGGLSVAAKGFLVSVLLNAVNPPSHTHQSFEATEYFSLDNTKHKSDPSRSIKHKVNEKTSEIEMENKKNIAD